ncbi:MAG TPA: hypothetical protein VF854_02625, partial [Azonexus sp.]
RREVAASLSPTGLVISSVPAEGVGDWGTHSSAGLLFDTVDEPTGTLRSSCPAGGIESTAVDSSSRGRSSAGVGFGDAGTSST